MRTLAAMACFTFAALTGCTPHIDDGQILCASSAPVCPDGFQCVSGGCYRNIPDVGVLDTAMDAPDSFTSTDANEDAYQRPEEVCTPSRMRGTVRADEDLDGQIDEGCALGVDIVHPMTSALPQVEPSMRDASVRFPRLSADGLTLTYCRMERLNEEVWQTRRSTLLSRFGPATRVSFPTMHRACVAQPHRDGYVFEGVRSLGGTLRRVFISRTPTSGPAIIEEVTSAVSGLNSGGSGHPFLSADGRQLFFEGNRSNDGSRSDGLFVTTREDAAWTEAMAVTFAGVPARFVREMFPTLSEDGLTLFFVRVVEDGTSTRTIPMVATRDSLDSLRFSQPIEIAGLADMNVGSFTVARGSWEAFLTSDAPEATAGRLSMLQRNEGLFHARLCAGDCPPRAPSNLQPCAGGVLSADGLRCYTTDGMPRTRAAAVTHCSEADAPRIRILASVHSEVERQLMGDFFTGRVWIGAEKATDGWAWSSGEPDTDNAAAPVYWATGQPNDGACVVLNEMGLGESVECAELHPAACEVDLWPTW